MKLAIGSIIFAAGILAASTPTTGTTSSSTSNGYAPQFSPTFPGVNIPTPVYNNDTINVNETLSKEPLDLTKYPGVWDSPDTKSPEVQAVITAIDWNFVPKIPVKKENAKYDDSSDPDCWWTSSGCIQPKVSYIPADIYTCPTPGVLGLSYDDGPFNLHPDDDPNAKTENPYAEPQLYNYLAQENVKASLFVSAMI